MALTTIYLVRHAHSEWRDDESRPLSPAGRAAAREVAERFAHEPIAAIYSSPSARAIETVTPLADRLGLTVEELPDLRERALPPVHRDRFEAQVAAAWQRPGDAPPGGESNDDAQSRGVAILRSLLRRNRGRQIVLATHGNLLALVLNGLNPSYGFAFWQQLSFPDVYRLTFDEHDRVAIERAWGVRG